MGPNFYDVLGVKPSADTAEIKDAWRRALRQVHPDKGGNSGLFSLVQEAYRTLSDEQRRAAYDQTLAAGGPTSAEEPTRRSADGGGPAGFEPRTTGTEVDVARLSWLDHVPQEPGPVTVSPPALRWLPWLARSLHAVAFVLGWYVTFTYNGGRSYDVTLAAFDDFAVIWASSALASTRFWKLVGPAVLVWLTFGWFDFVAETTGETVLFWSWVAAAVGAAAARGTRDVVSPDWLNQLVPVPVVRKFAVFGPAGQPVRQQTLETQMAARTGAEAAFTLTLLPGVRVFHAVNSSDGASADHVVVRGTKVALVNDVMWAPGSYSFSPLGVLLHNGSQFPYGDVDPRPAAATWTRELPRGTEVRSWVLVASAQGPVSVDNSAADAGVRAGTPQQVVDEIGAWFTDDPSEVTVQRRVLAVFARGLPQT